MAKKKCPICGTEMKIDTRVVCTSIPPKYRCVCPSCNCLDFINTSEYDQYKEEPSFSSNLDEAAEVYGSKEYAHAIHFWDEGMSKNKPEVLKSDFVNSFKAGAEWQKEQMMKEAVEGKIYGCDGLHWIETDVDENIKGKEGDKVRIIIVKEDER